MATQIVPLLERKSWIDFTNQIPWEQGEHTVCIAPTGRGKSVLFRAWCWRRDWVVWCSTKKKDDEYTRQMSLGYGRFAQWPIKKPPRDQRNQYALLWPDYKKLTDVYKAAPVFRKMLEDVYEDEGWTVVLDDLFFLSEKLKLRNEISALNYQVRSLNATLVSALQRPRRIPLETWDQASHAFLRPLGNYDDLLTIRSLAPVNSKVLEAWLRNLKPFEWLYLPVSRTDEFEPCIVKPPLGRIKPNVVSNQHRNGR